MKDIIERLEKATGSDRHLDAAIAVAVFFKPRVSDDLIYAYLPHKSDGCEPGTFWRKSRSGTSLHRASDYTFSIDTALTLVPLTYSTDVHSDRMETLPTKWTIRKMDDATFDAEISYTPTWNVEPPVLSEAGSPVAAIALCIAALKARQLSTSEREGT